MNIKIEWQHILNCDVNITNNAKIVISKSFKKRVNLTHTTKILVGFTDDKKILAIKESLDGLKLSNLDYSCSGVSSIRYFGEDIISGYSFSYEEEGIYYLNKIKEVNEVFNLIEQIHWLPRVKCYNIKIRPKVVYVATGVIKLIEDYDPDDKYLFGFSKDLQFLIMKKSDRGNKLSQVSERNKGRTTSVQGLISQFGEEILGEYDLIDYDSKKCEYIFKRL